MLGIFGFGGPWELVLILVVVLLLFGHRIPGMARSLGSGIVEFKKGLKSGDDAPEQLTNSKVDGKESVTSTSSEKAQI